MGCWTILFGSTSAKCWGRGVSNHVVDLGHILVAQHRQMNGPISLGPLFRPIQDYSYGQAGGPPSKRQNHVPIGKNVAAAAGGGWPHPSLTRRATCAGPALHLLPIGAGVPRGLGPTQKKPDSLDSQHRRRTTSGYARAPPARSENK